MGRGRGESRAAAVLLLAMLWVGAWETPAPAAREMPVPGENTAPTHSGLPEDFAGLVADQRGTSTNYMLVSAVLPNHRGYARSLLVRKEGSSGKTRVFVAMHKARSNNTQVQSHYFSWKLPSRALQMAPDLMPTSIDTRKGMGVNGRIKMTLVAPTRLARGTPPGCRGSVSLRQGLLVGSFGVHLRDGFFGRSDLGRLEAVVMKVRQHDCEDAVVAPPACPEHLSLAADSVELGVQVRISKSIDGSVIQSVFAFGRSGVADTAHSISVRVAEPDAFAASADLTTASVDADVAVSPWLEGDLEYLGTPGAGGEDPDCGPYESSSGFITGDYTAHFDSFGDASPATTGLAATLRRSPL